jgi:hypothetical protein
MLVVIPDIAAASATPPSNVPPECDEDLTGSRLPLGAVY